MPLNYKQTERTIRYEDESCGSSTAHSYTFYPTLEQIVDFPTLIDTIERETNAGSTCGVVKIVPPNGWKPRKAGYNNKLIGDTVINRPVTEMFNSGIKQKCYVKDVDVFRKHMTWNDLQNYAAKKKIRAPKASVSDRNAMDKLLWESMQQENLPDPVYGADTEGSLYDDDVDTLNISRLGTILDDLKKDINMPGVTTTYLYFGIWRTMFPWHTEDVDLYSINYLHHGSPKHWWSVPPEAADLFERMMSQLFRDDASKCSAFLRHKNYIVHPDLLTLYGIPFSMTTQRENEFIITFPRGYHMGYNTGNNVAESTNFASDRWVGFGMNYVMCKCKSDAVKINMDGFVRTYRDEDTYTKWNLYWSSLRSDEDRARAIAKGKYTLYLPDWRYSKNENNLFEERRYNRMRSRHFPHCAVCEAFLPSQCCIDKGMTPQRSRRFVTLNLFTKANEESVFDSDEDREWREKRRMKLEEGDEYGRFTPSPPPNDPQEDIILTCDNCEVSVHEGCYARRKNYDRNRDESTLFRCARCCQSDETRIRTTTCVLCELRGGALVKATLGSTNTYVHVICALAHRRAFFIEHNEYRNGVYIYPPSKYGADDTQMRRLSTPEYLNVPRPWDTLVNRYECEICKGHGEGLMVCSLCVSEGLTDVDIVHATCAREVGMRLERRTFPQLVVVICHRHERQIRLKIGTQVEVEKRKMSKSIEGNKEREEIVKSIGNVVGYVDDEVEDDGEEDINRRCIVDFENNDESLNTQESDIVKCWCGNCDGKTHVIDSPIVVLWQQNGVEYPAYYRGPTPPSHYKVQIDGEIDIVDTEDVSEYFPIGRMIEYEEEVSVTPAKKAKKAR